MTREQKIDRAINEVCEVLTENVVNYIEDFMANVDFSYVDFTEDTEEFIYKELGLDEDGQIIYDIMTPAIRKVLRVARQALVYDNF